VSRHLFKEVSEFGSCWEALIDFPKNFFIFIGKSLIVWVLQMSSPEWSQFHCHDEMRCRCCKDVRLHAIIGEALSTLRDLGLFLHLPQLWCVIRLRTHCKIPCYLGTKLFWIVRTVLGMCVVNLLGVSFLLGGIHQLQFF
jgi:hypothetical protein